MLAITAIACNSLLTGNSGVRALPDTVDVLRFPEMISGGDYPGPIPYGRRDYVNHNGFSDHYPIGMVLREG